MRVNGFYGHIQRNRVRSLIMFLGFILAMQIVAVVVLTTPLFFLEPRYCPLLYPANYFSNFTLPVLGGSLFLFLANSVSHLHSIEEMTGFRKVSKVDQPRLWRIVETQSLLAGVSMPEIAVVPSDALNAFAAGFGEKSAVVIVTEGLIGALDDEQLEAVVAHEITHIANGDIGVIAVANAMLTSVMMLTKWNVLRLDKWYKLLLCFVFFPLLFIYLIGGIIGYIGATLGILSRYMIAASREFIADARAVEMTKNPAALISALETIAGRSTIEGLDPQLDAMMIDGDATGIYASHPPISERIAVLAELAGGMAIPVARRKDTRPDDLRRATPQKNAAEAMETSLNQWARRRAGKGEPSGVIARLHQGSSFTVSGMPPALRVAALCLVTAFVALPAASSYLLRGYKTDRSTPAIAVKATPVARVPEASGITGKAIRPLARPY